MKCALTAAAANTHNADDDGPLTTPSHTAPASQSFRPHTPADYLYAGSPSPFGHVRSRPVRRLRVAPMLLCAAVVHYSYGMCLNISQRPRKLLLPAPLRPPARRSRQTVVSRSADEPECVSCLHTKAARRLHRRLDSAHTPRAAAPLLQNPPRLAVYAVGKRTSPVSTVAASRTKAGTSSHDAAFVVTVDVRPAVEYVSMSRITPRCVCLHLVQRGEGGSSVEQDGETREGRGRDA